MLSPTICRSFELVCNLLSHSIDVFVNRRFIQSILLANISCAIDDPPNRLFVHSCVSVIEFPSAVFYAIDVCSVELRIVGGWVGETAAGQMV